MAEAFGVISGAAGLISLLMQINSGIDTLRDIRDRAQNAPTEVASLTSELQFLASLMQDAINKQPSKNSAVLQHCQSSCDEVVNKLDGIKKRFLDESKTKGPKRLVKDFTFRHWKEDVEVLHRCIQGAKINLILVTTFRTSTQVEELALVNQLHRPTQLPHSANIPAITVDDVPRAKTQEIALALSPERVTSTNRILPMTKARGFERRGVCNSTRRCSCLCHRTAKTGSRFWALEYTPSTTLRCDRKSCDSAMYGFRFRTALSRIGIRWAAIIQFHIDTSPGTFVLRPAFRMQRVVPYTSPVFEILFFLKKGLITQNDFRERFYELERLDPTLRRQVTPAGMSLLGEFMFPSSGNSLLDENQEAQNFKFLINDLRIIEGCDTSRIVEYLCDFNEAEEKIELLDWLLGASFEAADVGEPDLSLSYSSDDFQSPKGYCFQIFERLCRGNPGFSGMTPLHEAVLFGSSELVNTWMLRSPKDEKNSLGQTAMHLAVRRPTLLRMLVANGHYIDSVDGSGLTPVEYAAGLNEQESMEILITAGADIYTRSRGIHGIADYSDNKLFFRIAAWFLEWGFVEAALDSIAARGYEDEVRQSGMQIAYHLLYFQSCGFHPVPPSMEHIRLLRKALSKATASKSNENFDHEFGKPCFLQVIGSVAELKVFLEHGLDPQNHCNDSETNKLLCLRDMVVECLTSQPGVALDLVGTLISAGFDINSEDEQGHTLLFFFDRTMTLRYEPVAVAGWHILVNSGADTLHSDHCRCSCSTHGCLPVPKQSSMRPGSYYHGSLDTEVHMQLHSISWLVLLEDLPSPDEARETVLGFIRVAKHDDLGMTHVCCGRDFQKMMQFKDHTSHLRWAQEYFYPDPLSDEDIDEILDEEEEFIYILNAEMGALIDLSYEDLLDYWFAQMSMKMNRGLRDISILETSDKSETQYYIDPERDCFSRTWHTLSYTNYVQYMTKRVSEYVIEMEILYTTGFLPFHGSVDREGWYSKWRTRLLQFLDSLGIISVESVADFIRQKMVGEDLPLCHSSGYIRQHVRGDTLSVSVADTIVQRFVQGTKHARVFEKVGVLDENTFDQDHGATIESLLDLLF